MRRPLVDHVAGLIRGEGWGTEKLVGRERGGGDGKGVCVCGGGGGGEGTGQRPRDRGVV